MTAVHFFDMAVDIAQGSLLGPEEALAALDDLGRGKTRNRHDDQRHQGQLPGDRQHHHEHADDRDNGSEDLLHGLGQRLRNGIDVVGHPGEHFTMGLSVKELQRQPVDLFGDLLAQVVGDLVGDPGQHPALGVVEQHAQHIDRGQSLDDGQNRREVNPAGAGILGADADGQQGGGTAQDLRADDVENGGTAGAEHDDDQLCTERLQISQQFADGAAEVLGLVTGHHASARSARSSSLCHAPSSSLLSCE